MSDHRAVDGAAACLTAALDYLGRGWSVLPLCPADHVGVGKSHRKCEHPGKRPFFPNAPAGQQNEWKKYQTIRATVAEVEGWYKYAPNLNLGMALGPVSGLVGIDVDSEDGEAKLRELSAGDLPPTLEYTTGKGRRLLYRLPDGASVKIVSFSYPATKAETLKIMAAGSQTVVPPSVHPSGKPYQWSPGRSPSDINPADAPAWMLAVNQAKPAAHTPVDGEMIAGGGRNNYLTRVAGAMRRQGCSEEAIYAGLVGTNTMCDPSLSDDEVRKIAHSVARYEPDEYAGVSLTFGQPEGANTSTSAPDGIVTWDHDQLLDADLPPVAYVVDGLIADASVTIFGGVQKAGKSWLSIQIAQAVAAGIPVLGRKVIQGQVAYLALEDGARRLQDRLRKQKSPLGLPIWWVTDFPKVDTPAGQTALTELIASKPRLLIIDTLAACKGGKTDESDSGPMSDLFNSIRKLAQQHGVAVVIVHHHGKSVSGDPAHDLRGSSAIGAAADVLLGLYRVRRRSDGTAAQRTDGHDPDDESSPDFYLKARGRDIEDTKLAVRFDAGGSWLWEIPPEGTHDLRVTKATESQGDIEQTLIERGPMSATGIVRVTGIPYGTVKRKLKELHDQGHAHVSEPGGGPKPELWGAGPAPCLPLTHVPRGVSILEDKPEAASPAPQPADECGRDNGQDTQPKPGKRRSGRSKAKKSLTLLS